MSSKDFSIVPSTEAINYMKKYKDDMLQFPTGTQILNGDVMYLVTKNGTDGDGEITILPKSEADISPENIKLSKMSENELVLNSYEFSAGPGHRFTLSSLKEMFDDGNYINPITGEALTQPEIDRIKRKFKT